MAVYSRLLLSTGGGIVSTQQQAEQTQNTATLLIGLGGTGVHCIRTIKTQVYTRLKPDNPNAAVPAYSHIRFLGVDAAEKSRGGLLSESPAQDNSQKSGQAMSLDGMEFFSIANKQLDRVFSEEGRAALQMRDDLTWLDWEQIPVPNLSDAGAGGIRQIGRFMMMDKSDVFYAKLEQEISAAKSGLENPRVNIHIFSGLSGGTGSGCFLDVCYMVRSLAAKMGGVTVFGYFFLPDVNLANVSYENVDVRSYIPKNGYAAMQELDYCMCLPQNGGSFRQVYKGHRPISWSAPPVSMCHLICATDQNNKEIPDAYNYALNVTAEYVMDFLTDSDKKFEFALIGAQMAYCVIGASCASIPLREINTYLASELFERFASISRNVPIQSDVEDLAISALALGAQNIDDVYEYLYREIQDGMSLDYPPYPDDWKFALTYGDSQLVDHYKHEFGEKVRRVESNAQSMVSSDNQRSIFGRITGALYDVLRDYNRGPIFAYRMLSAAESHNLLNLIDSWIRQNATRKEQESMNTDLREKDYSDACSAFRNRRNRKMFDSDKKRFADYEFYLSLLYQHRLSMEVYDRLDMVLREFRKQIVSVTASYYIKLSRVMDTLINTFEDNRNALASQQTLQQNPSFIIPMMTISDLKKTLDEGVAQINVPSMLDSFMMLLINNPDEWLQEDEYKITRLVTDFFVKNAFSGFASRTITNFLRDMYENKTGGKVTDEQLSNFIYADWMKLLTQRASPLFYSNNIWPQSEMSKLAFLSFPAESAAIKSAAHKMHNEQNLWGLKESALTDRIFVMCSACGLPLGSYNNCNEYERTFFSGSQPGRHYYEGKPVEGMAFDNWNNLPSVTPVSVITYGQAPLDLRTQLDRITELYEKACQFGLLDTDSKLFRPSAAALDAVAKACARCEAALNSAGDPKDIPALESAVAEIEGLLPIATEKTDISLPTDGFRKDAEKIKSIQKDHFFSSPGYHAGFARDLTAVEDATRSARAAVEGAKAKIQSLRQRGNALSNYANALFSGVIALEGRVVVYRPPYAADVILSDWDESYPFRNISVFQAFLTYQALAPEVVEEITKQVNARFREDSPELKKTGKKLKSDLGPNRIKAWAQASSTLEQKDEIQSFLSRISQQFDTFCLENDL